MDQPEAIGPGAEDEAYSELERLRTESGADSAEYCVNVFRKAADGLRWNYCKRLPLAGFDLDKLPETIGGGIYQLRIIGRRGKFISNINIGFDPDVWPITPVTSLSAAAPTGTPTLNDPALAGLVVGLQRQMDEDRKGRERFLETLVTALLTRGQGNTPSMTDMVDAQIKLRDLSGPPQKTDGDLMLQAMRLALEAGRGSGGEGSGGEADLFSKVIDKVAVPIIEAIRTQRQAAPRRPTALPPGNPPTGQSVGADMLPPELEPYRFLRQYSPHLLGWARTNFDPARVSGVIYNLVPDEFFPVLESFLARTPPERFSILIQLDPRLQPYQTYLDTVMNELSKEIAVDVEPGEREPGGNPDTATGQ